MSRSRYKKSTPKFHPGSQPARRRQLRQGNSKKQKSEIIAIGDVHGEMDGLQEVLIHAGVIDSRGLWRGGNKTLVQVGDVVDRGPYPFEANRLLSTLQRDAEAQGGKVIRLIGNHELEILRGNFYLTTLLQHKVMPYREEMMKDILENRVTAAFAAQGYLFTHAGLTSEMMETISAEISPLPVDEQTLADHINRVLVRAVQEGDFSHPIFSVGRSRGGNRELGGIFWEDIRVLSGFQPAELKQVVGHTPLKRIVQSDTGRLIGIDIGLFKGYGGGRGYLRIKKGRVTPVTLLPLGSAQ